MLWYMVHTVVLPADLFPYKLQTYLSRSTLYATGWITDTLSGFCED